MSSVDVDACKTSKYIGQHSIEAPLLRDRGSPIMASTPHKRPEVGAYMLLKYDSSRPMPCEKSEINNGAKLSSHWQLPT